MSRENVELSLLAVDAWNRRDVEALIALADLDVEWQPALEEIVERKTYRGHEGMRQYFTDLAEEGAESRAELTEVRDLGDQVLGLGRMWFRSATGVELNQDIALLHTWRDGKCIEARSWLSHAEGREAAGLSD
jgi:ketosteroid isomerase-like protein